jgi:hypothetical protein
VLSKLIFFRLRIAGLLPIARLVEGDRLRAEVPRAERLTRFNYDAPLIAVFMDRWRPETHTFHFLVGEMTLSLEDAAMLGGLSCAGEAMGRSIPARGTLTSLLGSRTFLRTITCRRRTCPSPTPTDPPGLGSSGSAYVIVTLIFNVCMPLKRMWRWTFVCVQADYMADDTDDQTSDGFLEVYLL